MGGGCSMSAQTNLLLAPVMRVPCKAHGPVVYCALQGMDVERSEECRANARRIIACVNACEGLDTELLENITTMGDTLASRFKMRDQVEREREAHRDELLEVLKHIRRCIPYGGFAQIHDNSMTLAQIDAAIAKAEGGAA